MPNELWSIWTYFFTEHLVILATRKHIIISWSHNATKIKLPRVTGLHTFDLHAFNHLLQMMTTKYRLKDHQSLPEEEMQQNRTV